MPLPSSRMTKQPAKPTRYFPGKALVEDAASDEESDSDEEEEAAPAKAPAPKVTSFPKKLAVDLANPKISTAEPQAAQPDEELEGFVTASESSDEEDAQDGGKDEGEEEEEDDYDSSSEEDSSSDDEPKKPMLAPKFISKAKRAQQQTDPVITAEDEARIRQEKADALLQAQIERDAALRAAGKKAWDDDDVAPEDEVDDTDDLDPEAERAAWKLRELKRVRRDREALIAKEKEREEVERRRNMSTPEREAADAEFIAKQEEERADKGKMGYMQKYFHKGAFFNADQEDMDEEVRAALNRDVAGRKFVDETGDKSLLPESMRMRDMTKLGKKGGTRYRDLKSEDTGRWGDLGGRKARDGEGLDERFRPDERGVGFGGKETTGANSAPVGERRRREDDGGRDGEGKRARLN
ncbi:unnamed protein product [Zymoseptoria tritici ST99CH_1A5]|uniref:Micro-fibrillar-associated protein 1 C-terminal domain-containing protein n=1 Tax=Zymoseptoria tritici ST99CH_1A5 TaxID=1276529 RepID=A0A1Y6LBI2_ZYMTR|nr:unnamed protein product [Zymoseptoria tritici ST99CH_1A5]